MKAIWTEAKPESTARSSFRPMMTWPKPVAEAAPAGHPGRAFSVEARRRSAMATAGTPTRGGEPEDYVPAFPQDAQEAGREPKSLSLRLGARRTTGTS